MGPPGASGRGRRGSRLPPGKSGRPRQGRARPLDVPQLTRLTFVAPAGTGAFCENRGMDRGRASTTAMGTALMRAAHTRLDDPVLIDDTWGERLVLPEEREAMLVRAGGGDGYALLRAHPSYGTVILRARYAEDVLAEAVRRGVRQYVIIGAGMDSFALRRPPFARDLEIFEVDHPSTQQLKADRLSLCGMSLPPGLHLVAADLSETALDDALASSPFRRDRPAFFSWLGVTPYLTREANLATLAAIASYALAGSELVFSYLDQRLLDSDGGQESIQRARAQVASIGEPWVSGFHPDQLHSDLRGEGLEMVENLGPEELGARYCAGRTDGLTPSPGSHIAHARVVV
jgi:methyltransferase (TIGR00027 family)